MIVELEFLIMDVQQLSDIFSITLTNLRAVLNVLFLETNDVRSDDVTGEISVQRRRTRICNLTLLITQWQLSTVGLCV